MHITNVTLHPEDFPTREKYPFNLPIFHQTRELIFTTPVTVLIGENGTGKSTLLEAIAHRCGITIWRGPSRGRFERNPYEEDFFRHIRVEWADGMVPGSFFGSSVFQSFAQILDEWAASDPAILDLFGGRSLMTQSHGQSILSFFRSRYRLRGLYLLDEPETALSPKNQIRLLEILTSMGSAGHAQFIVATHSPILLACPEASIFSFDHVPIRRVSYEETDIYRVYKGFMEDRHRYMKNPGSAAGDGQ
ncbi:MAG TPA: AAA family ATPase [Deltaproteobacteria bacterium]|nr:AAA family ATPase [Deltaproteobacteria bacterium]